MKHISKKKRKKIINEEKVDNKKNKIIDRYIKRKRRKFKVSFK